jgi:hypothetical protein
MAKRLIDTGIFRDPWFMELAKDAKLLYIYLFCNCNHAGLYEVNEKLIKFETSITQLDQAFEQLANRYVTVIQGLIFLPKFISFQYPNFPNSKVKAQNSAIEILTKNGLFANGCLTVSKPLDKGYEYEYDNDNGNDNDNDNVEDKNYKYYINKELDLTFIDFIDTRKKIKKPMTGKAIKLAINKLEEFAPNDDKLKIKIIEQSIFNSWQGLFPLKSVTSNPTQADYSLKELIENAKKPVR